MIFSSKGLLNRAVSSVSEVHFFQALSVKTTGKNGLDMCQEDTHENAYMWICFYYKKEKI